MLIKELRIQNFRCYYGEVKFEFGPHLNLILGENGGGKTTIFDVFKWLFDTSETIKENEDMISAKRLADLQEGDQFTVSASLKFESNGEKILEKSFKVSKKEDKSGIVIFDQTAKLYSTDPITKERRIEGINVFDRIFPAVNRRYSLFKGESSLNIFNNINGNGDNKTLKELVNIYSDVKDFTADIDFLKYALPRATTAKDKAIRSASNITKKIDDYERDIKDYKKKIAESEGYLEDYNNDINAYNENLRGIQSNEETARKNREITKQIEETEKELQDNQVLLALHTDYNVRLMDKYWVLFNFEPFRKKFSKIIANASKEKISLNNEYIENTTVNKIKEGLKNGTTPLQWFIPDYEAMKDMLKDHICKVCNRPAPEDSDAYKFMYNRLLEFEKQSNKKNNNESKVESLFKNDYIEELYKLNIMLEGDVNVTVNDINAEIKENIKNVQQIRDIISKKLKIVEDLKKRKINILAQTAYDTDTLDNMYKNITEWVSRIQELNDKIQNTNADKAFYEKQLEEVQAKYDALAQDDDSKSYLYACEVLNCILHSFEHAKSLNFDEIVSALQNKANEYMSRLNAHDFIGTVSIKRANENVIINLVDKNGLIVRKPSTSQETTKHIAILFAISDLSREKDPTSEFPFIFDAPASSFDDAKLVDFFEFIKDFISKANKQCIIAVKPNSYLLNKINNVHYCDGYIISKKAGYDNKDLSSIEVKAKPIN
jgi:DNA sulfur modification protein DndD